MTASRAAQWLRSALLMACAAAAATPAGLSEISVDAPQNVLRGFVMMSDGGGDDPSPWPTWTVVRPMLDATNGLNTGGDLNGDLRPGFALRPGSGRPEVVWAWWDGTDYEIVLSRWTGSEWSAWRQLTDNAVDDLDPEITIGPDGVPRVTWWRRETATPSPEERVWFVEAVDAAADTWSGEELVTGSTRTGRQPDVALRAGVTWIAFAERLTNVMTPDRDRVFVARNGANGWQHVRLGPIAMSDGSGTPRPELAVKIHAKRGALWVTWVEESGLLAYRVYRPETDSWSPAETLAFGPQLATAGHDAIAVEMARQRVAWRVLGD